ncbi:hypothetical protein CLPUN_21010 [Clostridium puniceum]|uniref:DUF8042 domain-containing protein n=1 Tax=Clostridium puniceum TaxID=29367 RepID=A0A1S8TJI0_9CLOT|nr:hypothetical protein [Clostridium puniceum]OOM77928.1 hypothetical protein CLPUN_21010 [Clostridium puniceum]
MNGEKIEALSSANEYLYNLKGGIKSIVEAIQEGREQEGINLVSAVAEGIDWVSNVINLTKDIQKNEIEIQDINEQIEAIIEALENEDYILVGDLFNYEILPILDRVHDEIQICIAN